MCQGRKESKLEVVQELDFHQREMRKESQRKRLKQPAICRFLQVGKKEQPQMGKHIMWTIIPEKLSGNTRCIKGRRKQRKHDGTTAL